MRIQIIEKGKHHYNSAHLDWFKETCDACSSEYGAEKLDWLHVETIDDRCDVFIQPLSPTEVKFGFVLDTNKALSTNNPIHWLNITVLDTSMFDALTQTLLVTIGMSCIRSVTGRFSTDWSDIKAVLSYSTMAYCSIFDWNTSQQLIERLRADMSQLKWQVASCAMLLNQGLRLNQVFENVQNLISTDIIPADCLTITNVTNSEKIPQTNVLMFVCKNN